MDVKLCTFLATGITRESRKAGKRERRSTGKILKEYEVRGSLKALATRDLLAVTSNKANLQHFLSTYWAKSEGHGELHDVGLRMRPNVSALHLDNAQRFQNLPPLRKSVT